MRRIYSINLHFVRMVKFGRTENLIDVIMQYEVFVISPKQLTFLASVAVSMTYPIDSSSADRQLMAFV